MTSVPVLRQSAVAVMLLRSAKDVDPPTLDSMRSTPQADQAPVEISHPTHSAVTSGGNAAAD